jgi:hypothetical protein
MPERNAIEKPSMTSGGTPSAASPGAVKATCSAVSGGGCTDWALVTGAERSQARAALASRTRSRAKRARVSRPWPNRSRPWMSA